MNKYKVLFPQNLKGNFLEISDKSVFALTETIKNQSGKNVSKWWEKIPNLKKKIPQNKIKEAVIDNRLRELGQWLTVKDITTIRTSLLSYAKTKEFNDIKNIYFANANEVINNNVDENDSKNKKIFMSDIMNISCQTQLLRLISKKG